MNVNDTSIAYVNGRYVPSSQCVLPMYDAGIVLGAAVTDLLRTFQGRPFAAVEHVHRFFESAKYAYLDLPMTESDTLDAINHLVSHNSSAWPKREIAIILYASAGEFSTYAGAAASAGSQQATVVFHCFPLPLWLWKESMTDGVHVVTPAQRHIHPNTLSSKIKHRNRLHMWIGDKQAKLVDLKAVGLYLDLDGNISESSGANFVIFKRGTVVCPRRNNILWGVSLEVVSRLSRELGLGFVEQDIQIHDVVNADEAWLTSTPYFLAPVVRANGIPIGSGKPGRVWRQLMDALSKEVGVDVLQQILDDSP